MLVAVSRHPVAAARRGLEALQAVADVGTADRIVHGALIAIIFAMVFSFTVYTLERSRLYLGATAWVAFFAGNLCVIGAALTDGFFVPAFAERYLRSVPLDATPGLTVLNAASVAIQVLTKFGFLAISLATLCWSIDLLLEGRGNRGIALLGFAAPIVVAALLFFGGNVNVHSLLIIIGLQATWYFAISYRMIKEQPASNLSSDL
jgi:hypothetical protein